MGNAYDMKFAKECVFRRNSKNFKDEEIDDERTFFCSELVAKTYKILGFMVNDNIPCSKYFPGHFAQKNCKINFTPGCSLGEEMPIYTNENIEF